jgi:hypothetical protein
MRRLAHLRMRAAGQRRARRLGPRRRASPFPLYLLSPEPSCCTTARAPSCCTTGLLWIMGVRWKTLSKVKSKTGMEGR